MATTEQNVLEMMSALDAFSWISNNNIQLSHGPWSLRGHEYQLAWLQDNSPESVFIKGAQIGVTDGMVLKTLHGMLYGKYKQGSLYLFPTRDDVKDFSKEWFDPLIESNPCIKWYVEIIVA